jgi:hypothetical protein
MNVPPPGCHRTGEIANLEWRLLDAWVKREAGPS